jgi:hypothetical protein
MSSFDEEKKRYRKSHAWAPLTLLSLASCVDMLRLGEAVILASFGITVVFFSADPNLIISQRFTVNAISLPWYQNALS